MKATLLTQFVIGIIAFLIQLEIVWSRNAVLSGFIFAWLSERTGSLIMPLFAHGAWDFFLFLPRMM